MSFSITSFLDPAPNHDNVIFVNQRILVFEKSRNIFLVGVLLLSMLACAERPDQLRVKRDFNELKKSILSQEKIYASCKMELNKIFPVIEKWRDKGWQVYHVDVFIECPNSQHTDRLRFLYEYVIDFKRNSTPVWELATFHFVRKFPD